MEGRGVPVGTVFQKGSYHYIPDGRHGPDRDDPALAMKVLTEILGYLGTK